MTIKYHLKVNTHHITLKWGRDFHCHCSGNQLSERRSDSACPADPSRKPETAQTLSARFRPTPTYHYLAAKFSCDEIGQSCQESRMCLRYYLKEQRQHPSGIVGPLSYRRGRQGGEGGGGGKFRRPRWRRRPRPDSLLPWCAVVAYFPARCQYWGVGVGGAGYWANDDPTHLWCGTPLSVHVRPYHVETDPGMVPSKCSCTADEQCLATRVLTAATGVPDTTRHPHDIKP